MTHHPDIGHHKEWCTYSMRNPVSVSKTIQRHDADAIISSRYAANYCVKMELVRRLLMVTYGEEIRGIKDRPFADSEARGHPDRLNLQVSVRDFQTCTFPCKLQAMHDVHHSTCKFGF